MTRDEVRQEFIAFVEAAGLVVRPSPRNTDYIYVASTAPKKDDVVLVSFPMRGTRRWRPGSACVAVEVAGSFRLKTVFYLSRSRRWRERALARVVAVGGFSIWETSKRKKADQ